MRLDQRLKPALLFRKELLEEGIGHVLASSPPPAPMDMQPVPDGIGRKRLRAIAPPPMRGRFFVYSEPRYCQKSRADDESGAPLRFMP